MEKRNMPLSNDEIFAVLLYCNKRHFVPKFEISKKRFKFMFMAKIISHLCCAVYKIWLILHDDNDAFYKHYVKKREKVNRKWVLRPNALFRGEYNLKMDMNTDKYPLHTITSFTSNFEIAKGFTNNNGLMIALHDAFKAMYEGQLKAGDVSWISKYPERGIYFITNWLKNIRFVQNTKQK